MKNVVIAPGSLHKKLPTELFMFGKKNNESTKKELQETKVTVSNDSQPSQQVSDQKGGFSFVDAPYYAFLTYIAFLIIDSIRIVLTRSAEVPITNP